MTVTGWSEVSLDTYLKKNKLDPFLLKLQNRKLKVLMDGSDISEAFLDETFTQKGPKNVVVSAGDTLTGELDRYELLEPLGSGAVAQRFLQMLGMEDLRRRFSEPPLVVRL